MRRTLSILTGLTGLLAGACLSAAGLTVAELQAKLDRGVQVTLIDVRSPQEFRQDHIPGAINIPASLCPAKTLPPLGAVVVYGDGLPGDPVGTAAPALAAKKGLTVDVLTGGYAAWEDAAGLTTRGAGLRPERFHYITYDRLKAQKGAAVKFYDLRRPGKAGVAALTDLGAEFPGAQRVTSRAEAVNRSAGAASMVVLVDNGDGTAEQEARMLKLGGTHGMVILAGGEMILARHGQAGLQRDAATTAAKVKTVSPGGGTSK